MAAIRRTHYFLPRKANESSAIKVVTDKDVIDQPDYMAEVMLKIICRLYELREENSYGALGNTA